MTQRILAGKKILLGVTGSIAAYKAPDFVRRLTEEQARVTVILTGGAARFVTPLTFQAVSGQKVYSDMFDADGAELLPHIALGQSCDLVLVAPATANTIAKLAYGTADNLLTAVILASKAKVVVCPAMNSQMYLHPATQNNLATLTRYGYQVVSPDSGAMACGACGPGRLPPWETIREAVLCALIPQDLAGRFVLITAGPTREAIDPVRFVSNRSSGKMGYALARTAKRRGAQVLLISGPTSLTPPPGIECIQVTSAEQMREAVLARQAEASIIVKTAAVSDYRPTAPETHKIKKTGQGLTLTLVSNPDILAELGRIKKKRPELILVGFAAESRDFLAEGRKKLQAKNLDLMAVNDITRTDSGFDAEDNLVTLIDRTGRHEELPLLPKEAVADTIWDKVLDLF